MDEVIETSKEMMTDSESSEFWPVQTDGNTKDGDRNGDGTNDGVIMETTAHPFPSSLISSSMDHRRRKLEMQMLPKRIVELNRQLQSSRRKLDRQKEATASTMTYWKGKTKEISTKNADLVQRMEVCCCSTEHTLTMKPHSDSVAGTDSECTLFIRFSECISCHGLYALNYRVPLTADSVSGNEPVIIR